MSDVLITGLGIGKAFGACDVDNMNYRVLLQNPHALLWADQICLPNNSYFSDDVLGKEYELVYGILDHNNILKRYAIENYNIDRDFNDFLSQAAMELSELEKVDPQNVMPGDKLHVPFETLINNYHYCAPKIASLNASLFLANEMNANCLLDKDDEYYLEKRFEITKKYRETQKFSDVNDVYKELFSVKLPNDSILHEYGMYVGCKHCKKARDCDDSYLLEVEKRLISFLTIRNYDEMKELRLLVNDIVKKSNELTLSDKEKNKYILSEIDKKQLKIKRNIISLSPKAYRFANLVGMVAIPFTISNAMMNNQYMTIAGAVLTGLSSLPSKITSIYSSKYNWVNFIDRNNNRC